MPDKPIPNKPAIAASEERFRALVTATSDVIYGLSADWSVMYELDGRGFLKDTNEPITDWQSRNINPPTLKNVRQVSPKLIAKKKFSSLSPVYCATMIPPAGPSRPQFLYESTNAR